MYACVCIRGSLLACSQMTISQLEHLIALWAFAADLHRASGHLLLLYKILLCMSIKSGITGGAACQVSARARVVLSEPVLVY